MKWRWPITGLAAALLLAASVHWAVDRFTREPPNYTRIEAGLWLGGHVDRPPPGTTAVLNLCESPDPYTVESHRWQPIADAVPAPSLDWLHEQVRFIQSERAAGRAVFIHCQNGVSRSGMVTAAYLMAREGWSRNQALAFLRSRRPAVRPHPVFLALLLEWESRNADP